MTIDIGNMSRRDLLKSASVAALVAGAGSLAIPRRGAAQDANTLRVLSVEDPFFSQ